MSDTMVKNSPYPRRGDPRSLEYWWYRKSPQHLWGVVMICWGIGIVERCGSPASFPLDECPGEWIGPISPPDA